MILQGPYIYNEVYDRFDHSAGVWFRLFPLVFVFPTSMLGIIGVFNRKEGLQGCIFILYVLTLPGHIVLYVLGSAAGLFMLCDLGDSI
jgi:hypothetical protein